MREIKFNLYNKLEKIYIRNNGNTILPNGFLVERVFYSKKDEYELIQYTGLRDKNNREIYEGDIVRVSDNYNRLVELDDSCGCCEKVYGFSREFQEYEVIGNIYENTELLKND